jgi:hypothetical protein
MSVSAGDTGARTSRYNKPRAVRFLSTVNLYILGLLCVALTISSASLAIWQLRRDRITEVRQDSHDLAVVLAAQADLSFQAIDLILREAQERVRAAGVATQSYSDNLGSEEMHRFLVDRVRSLPQIDAIALIDNAGRIVNLSRAWPAPAVDLSDRDFFAYWHDHDEPGPL